MENKSPSSRRAWIEIYAHPDYKGICRVALLAEGVGRNFGAIRVANKTTRSPSSRRAWVEI